MTILLVVAVPQHQGQVSDLTKFQVCFRGLAHVCQKLKFIIRKGVNGVVAEASKRALGNLG